LITAVPISNPERPGWLEICIDIDPVAHESVSAFLFDLGCTGIVSEDLQGHSLKAYLPFQKNPYHFKKTANIHGSESVSFSEN
jgi:hypothetical protein